MKEYIEREAVLNRLKESIKWCENELDVGEFRRGCIASLRDEIGNIKHSEVIPSADVEEVRHGEWIESDWIKHDRHGRYVLDPNAVWCCSECRCVFNKSKLWTKNYCPNCGAKMDGGKSND